MYEQAILGKTTSNEMLSFVLIAGSTRNSDLVLMFRNRLVSERTRIIIILETIKVAKNQVNVI